MVLTLAIADSRTFALASGTTGQYHGNRVPRTGPARSQYRGEDPYTLRGAVLITAPYPQGASNGEERIGDSEAADASRDDRAAGEPEQRRSSPYSNAGKLEGIRPPDLHPNWKSSGPYPLSSTQGSVGPGTPTFQRNCE